MDSSFCTGNTTWMRAVRRQASPCSQPSSINTWPKLMSRRWSVGSLIKAMICSPEKQLSSDLRIRRPEFFKQHRYRFTQMELVVGGVCEEESALSNKGVILDSSGESRSFSSFNSFKRFSHSSDSILSYFIRFSLSRPPISMS